MRATLHDVVHVQRTACWRCCPWRYQQVGLLFFREEIELVETEIRVFADWNHIDRELKRRRHPRSLYSWCTRRIVENEASARRNLLAFLREKSTTCLSVGVKLYLKVRLLLFSCAKEVWARISEVGQGSSIRKTSLLESFGLELCFLDFELSFPELSGVSHFRARRWKKILELV